MSFVRTWPGLLLVAAVLLAV
ncbi:MAG: hypothetical protein JWR42_1254, partial [Marmoricola sp.]|nr:hypothetical protein [Marmoricola sp.]